MVAAVEIHLLSRMAIVAGDTANVVVLDDDSWVLRLHSGLVLGIFLKVVGMNKRVVFFEGIRVGVDQELRSAYAKRVCILWTHKIQKHVILRRIPAPVQYLLFNVKIWGWVRVFNDEGLHGQLVCFAVARVDPQLLLRLSFFLSALLRPGFSILGRLTEFKGVKLHRL